MKKGKGNNDEYVWYKNNTVNTVICCYPLTNALIMMLVSNTVFWKQHEQFSL